MRRAIMLSRQHWKDVTAKMIEQVVSQHAAPLDLIYGMQDLAPEFIPE